MRRALLGIGTSLALAACGAPPEQKSFASEQELAGQAMAALQARLLEALTQALEEGGPEQALSVCRDVAQDLTREVSLSEGIAVGRTSHRLRNPENAPPDWAREVVLASAGLAADAADPHLVDLGDRVGVLRPIGTLGLCTTCHGSALEPKLQAKLAELYPEDAATGFEVGDLRGWAWAEVPVSR